MQAQYSVSIRRQWLAAIAGESLLILASGLMTLPHGASFQLLGLCVGSVGLLILMLGVLDPVLPMANFTLITALKLQGLAIALISGGAMGYIAWAGV